MHREVERCTIGSVCMFYSFSFITKDGACVMMSLPNYTISQPP